MKELTTKEEIKAAVDAGAKVFADTTAYEVIKDSIGQYLIHHTGSSYYIGLHGLEGTQYQNKLNAKRFFTAE